MLVLGKSEDAIALIDEIFNFNIKEKNINLNELRILIMLIIATILKVANDIDKYDQLNYKRLYFNLEHLVNMRNFEHIKKDLYDFIDKLCVMSKKNNQCMEQQRIQDIKNYIKENYANQDLNVNIIADIFNLTPSWLSKYFKQHTKDGLANYIVKYRIEKAKELIKNTNKNINTIAIECGFSSSIVFQRAFKRYEGITPKQYREYT